MGVNVSAGFEDIHYSVERYFAATFTSLNLAFEGQKFDASGLPTWVHVSVLAHNGRGSRAAAYSADVRISVRIHSRVSQRGVRAIAQALEADLRGGTIPVYDTDAMGGSPIGDMRVLDPQFQPLPRDGSVHMGVFDAPCIVNMDLS